MATDGCAAKGADSPMTAMATVVVAVYHMSEERATQLNEKITCYIRDPVLKNVTLDGILQYQSLHVMDPSQFEAGGRTGQGDFVPASLRITTFDDSSSRPVPGV